MKLFDESSSLQRFLNWLADMMILNLITLVCCAPVITAGASLTAMHYVVTKTVKHEEGYVLKSFFKSFRLNFVQSTVLWMIFLLIGGALYWNVHTTLAVLTAGSSSTVLLTSFAMSCFAMVLLYMIALYVFPLQSRYTNPVGRTLLNAIALAFQRLARSFCMMVIMITPVIMLLRWGRTAPLWVLFGLSVPAYACAILYVPVFDKLEEKSAQAEKEAE